MGGALSSKFKEAMDAETREMATPVKRIHRILDADFDPRSPTVGVDRTPIAIAVSPLEDKEKEQVYGSPPALTICSTPQVEALKKIELDPRSPTDGIFRTPIQLNGPTVAPVEDPRSPTIGVPRTPIVTEDVVDVVSDLRDLLMHHDAKSDSVPNIDAIPAIADLDLETMNRSLSEPDLTKEDVNLLRHRNGSGLQMFRESTPKKKSERKVHCQVLSHEDLSSKSIQVKDRSPLVMRDSQRSPLTLRTNVDVNSPRNIVQRKQATKLSMSIKNCKLASTGINHQSPVRYQAREHTDKENMLDF